MEYNDKQIGRNIKAIRNANKKSYLDFADAIGISDSLLEKIENGTRHATDEIIQLISKSTGFSFNEIKYKDLSYLEKGELYFDEECSLGDFTKATELEASFIDALKLQFPIVEDEAALEDPEFSAGIRIAHEKIQSVSFSSEECISAINHFIHACKQQICADLSAINILSCFGYLYCAAVLSPLSESESQALLKKKIAALSDYFGALGNSISQSKIQSRKKDYLKKYNGFLTTYMRKLVESQKHSDYAYYFLCIRYLLGIMDEGITLIDEDQMRVFGESMFDSLWKMGNKYAKALYDHLEN